MIISFDIDNTLIPYNDEFEVQPLRPIARLFGAEPLRTGTSILFKELEKQRHELWIYTTSFRSIFRLKKTFWLQGLAPKRYINGAINRQVLKANHCTASKHPGLFGIDVHIDDAEGVAREGERYGFQTIIVQPSDSGWVQAVLTQLEVIGQSS